jgi:hypothetical protein
MFLRVNQMDSTNQTELKDTSSEEVKELSDWKNPPKVSDLKQDFKDAKPNQDAQIVKLTKWLDNLNVTGTAVVKSASGKSQIVPKLIRKQAEWRYAALTEPFLSSDDIFNVDPVTFEDKEGAIQNELVLNNQFNTKLNKVQFIDEYIRTAVDEGTVIVRVGWEYEDEIIEVDVPDFQLVPIQDPMQLQQHQQLHQMMQEAPEEFAAQVPPELQEAHQIFMQTQGMQQVQVGSHKEKQTKILKNHPTVDIADTRNVTIDPTCEGNLDKASFIVYSFETSLSQLKKDGRYKNLDQIGINSQSVLSDPDHTTQDTSAFTFKDGPRKKFVAYEYWGYWDIDGDGIAEPIVATWVNNTLIRLEENPFPDGKPPFVLVQYLPVRKSLYGEPDGSLLEDNQKILGAVTRGMIDIMGRSANGQMASRKDALDVTNKRKFEKGLDYEFNANIDPRQAFHMHTYPEIPQSAQYMVNLQNMEAESLTGVKAFHGGISGAGLGNTATGVRGALDAASKRELGILRRMAEGIKQIGRKIIGMNAEFLSEEEIVRVTNDEFIPVRRDDLPGNYDLRLTISTAEADNQKAEELAFMLQTTAQSMGPEFAQIILTDIARLRKMPDLAKKIEEYKPQPDPYTEQMKQLELELKQAQVRNEAAKGAENEIDSELKKAKISSELAKAKANKSKADLDDLTFLERESGTDQEKNLELQRAKVEGDVLKERAKYLNAKAGGSNE